MWRELDEYGLVKIRARDLNEVLKELLNLWGLEESVLKLAWEQVNNWSRRTAREGGRDFKEYAEESEEVVIITVRDLTKVFRLLSRGARLPDSTLKIAWGKIGALDK